VSAPVKDPNPVLNIVYGVNHVSQASCCSRLGGDRLPNCATAPVGEPASAVAMPLMWAATAVLLWCAWLPNQLCTPHSP
jgi:hypothetical protein